MPLRNLCGALFQDYLLLFFIVAIILYGSLSSPTPDHPALIEIIISLLLITSVGISGLYNLGHMGKQPYWSLVAKALFAYGLTVPLLMAVINDGNLTNIIRDIAGFISLCLPLFVVPFLSKNETRGQYFFYGVLFIGLAFGLRVLFQDFSFLSKHEELLYLANSPLVLLAALYLTGLSIQLMMRKTSLRNSFLVLLSLSLSVIPLAAMYLDFQRISFFGWGMTILIVTFMGFVKAPFKVILPLIVMGVLGFIFLPQIMDIGESIVQKTAQVGLNMRYQEWQAVWGLSSHNISGLLFGQGWGASFASPAVGGLNVNYTHSLLSYMLLKTGLVGLILTVVYLYFMFEKLIRVVFIEPVKGNALIWPLMIPILLYASYKSLDYGFVLAIICLLQTPKRIDLSNNE